MKLPTMNMAVIAGLVPAIPIHRAGRWLSIGITGTRRIAAAR
jgi:hypothetical protein